MSLWGRLVGGGHVTSVPREDRDQVVPHLLGQIGHQDEALRNQISLMASKLEELASLSSSFVGITEPFGRMLDDHSQSRMRLAETEALLNRERENIAKLRSEFAALKAREVSTSHEFELAQARLLLAEKQLRENGEELDRVRRDLAEKLTFAEDWERQALAHEERAGLLTGELGALKGECEGLENAKAITAQRISDLEEQLAFIESDRKQIARRAQGLSDQVNRLSGQNIDLEGVLASEREALSQLQTRLSAEITTRQRFESSAQAERALRMSETSALNAKLQSFETRLLSTDKIQTQLKAQLNEKTAMLAVADRSLKNALVERAPLDRQLQVLQDEVERSRSQLNEEQKTTAELRMRNEVLSNAVSLKDNLIVAAKNQTESHARRFEEAAAEYNRERALLDGEIRRLSEEVHRERAERELANGALDAARSSRAALLSELTVLKRGGAGSAVAQPGEPVSAVEGAPLNDSSQSPATNVAFLRTGPK